jgi:hypothetical protein
MNFSLEELKEALYISETLFGIFLLVPAYLVLKMAVTGSDSLYNLIPGIGLLFAAITCIIFGIGTYLVRDDPDVWR